MDYAKGTHDFDDRMLVTGKTLADLLGVSAPAITKALHKGRLDTYENSKGRKMYHPDLAREQMKATRNPAAVSVTKAQKAKGMDGFDARREAVAVAVREESVRRQTPTMRAITREAVNMGVEQRPMTDEEAFDFAVSRAKREHYQAALAELKVQESAGRLVDKAEVGARVSALANSVKDRLMSMHVKVSALVMGPLENALVAGGLDAVAVRSALSSGSVERSIAETVRKELLDALRDLVEGEKGLLDG